MLGFITKTAFQIHIGIPLLGSFPGGRLQGLIWCSLFSELPPPTLQPSFVVPMVVFRLLTLGIFLLILMEKIEKD